MVTIYYSKKYSLKPANVTGTEGRAWRPDAASAVLGAARTAFRSSRDDAGSTRGTPVDQGNAPKTSCAGFYRGSVSRAWSTHMAGLIQLLAPPKMH